MKVAALQMVSGVALQPNLRGRTPAAGAGGPGRGRSWRLPEYFCAMGLRRDEDKLALRDTMGDGRGAALSGAKRRASWACGSLAARCPWRGRSAARVQQLAGVLARGRMRGALRQDPPVSLRQRPRAASTRRARIAGRPGQRALCAAGARRPRVARGACSVCYDLRFPELYRDSACTGADLLLVPSAFTYTTGQAHWEVLLRARAMENLAYVLAPAPGRQARERPPHLGPQHAGRPLGAGAGPAGRGLGRGAWVTLDAAPSAPGAQPAAGA